LQSQLYTVSEVALRSGFSDAKYFSRLFKARFGLSPKEYQQSYEITHIPGGTRV
jgi:AraC-like DNA-binding protein